MNYNMTPTCVCCGRTRIAYDVCGYEINGDWTCYGCIIKDLEKQNGESIS